MPQTLIIAEAGINHNRSIKTALQLVDAAKVAGADVVKFQLEYPTELCLTYEETLEVIEHCKSVNMLFACTAFDVPTLEFLLKNYKLPFIKIASCDNGNMPLLMAAKESHMMVIQSLKRGDNTIRFGQTFLHVVAEYPTPAERANLRRVPLMDGISDHSQGINIPIAAVALGASVVEKHLTLHRHQDGPDHWSSIEPREFKQMVDGIREIEQAMLEPAAQ